MSDTYENFAALASAEAPDAYAMFVRSAGSRVVVAAPHGGGIEPGTSEIALAIAGDDLSCYLFEGRKESGNKALHITSSNFDEPQCLSLLRAASLVLTVHGERSDAEVVYLGGRNATAMAALRSKLEPEGFTVRVHTNSELQGSSPRNICNIGSGGAGVQLELSLGLRKSFFQSLSPPGRQKPRSRLAKFSMLVRSALLENSI